MLFLIFFLICCYLLGYKKPQLISLREVCKILRGQIIESDNPYKVQNIFRSIGKIFIFSWIVLFSFLSVFFYVPAIFNLCHFLNLT